MPHKYDGYDVIPTQPEKGLFVTAPARPYNQTAKVMLVGWHNHNPGDDKPHLATCFGTEDDIETLRKLRDGLTEIIECKLEHNL